jgi:hypothetical protein
MARSFDFGHRLSSYRAAKWNGYAAPGNSAGASHSGRNRRRGREEEEEDDEEERMHFALAIMRESESIPQGPNSIVEGGRARTF